MDQNFEVFFLKDFLGDFSETVEEWVDKSCNICFPMLKL